ncbi:penicillin-binding transpeptidase domain-containing protein [Faecalicatena contorta]|uniref:penicillin-binding transpeptidase domain-containing protein n=1 Tax=Faecalicatena contorta TaxID=39482 RepID=UPI001F203E2D|nr:penicillin-binding transpeptidase domain-containing protein [Faecalicatena contorta]MCF2554894.1 penicillin-binding protein [Faecalicatena contorta]
MWERIKSGIYEIVKSRVFLVIIVFSILSAILLQRTFYLQIVKGQDYLDKYELQIQKTKEVEGTRGNIYDRNGVLLAYNELAYSVTIEDNGEYDSTAQKNEELNKVVTTVINMVESNGDTVINDFGIILDNDGTYAFTAESNTQRLRFIADVYGLKTIDELSEEQKNQSAGDIIDYLCTDKRYGYGIDQKELGKDEVLKLINIRYAISLNSYQKYIATTIAEDVSDETVADVMENSDALQGVSIEEESLRRYTDSMCFANIIGYTGQISTEEYDALSKEDQEKYDKNDTIGKAGIEKTMDSVLKGEKGEVKLYVNSVGKVIEKTQESEPEAGNDLYLSIDANLQKAAYHILEQELAGILLSKIQNTLSYDRSKVSDGSDVIIPIGDVYDSFISNEILNMNHFAQDDAKATEKEVYAIFSSYKEELLGTLEQIFSNADAATYKDSSKEIQAYLTYIVTDILTRNTGVIMSGEIDTNDVTYKAWKEDESINIYTYLNYAISKNWVDSAKLKEYVAEGNKYTDSSELYEGLKKYLLEYLKEDSGFDKLIYKYMIKDGRVTGRQICLMLYEQEVLEYDEAQYQALLSGATGPYDFIRGKIQTLDITPGQLALEPCTGSFVMTDTKTGQVLACVSYPGYDNNRLANTMDSAYYNKLVTDNARPFYNNATQEKTAPGSTYKPLVSIAGLTEGVINTQTVLPCHGVYEKVTPNPKCWVYPNAHGSLNVEGAIENSCNCFYYEVGYRLSLTDNGRNLIGSDNNSGSATSSYYSSDVGTDTLAKYASMFGLNETSGIEIPEAEPQISDESSVPSAIGQGTNNYTTSQLARYVTTIANKGTLFDLTLFDKVTSVEGELIEEFEPKVEAELSDISASTWNAVHNGMRNVVLVSHSSSFTDINRSDLKLSGKTGTAQQSKTHPDHALFVGFAPSDNPEIAFATRIANGYSSTFACEVARDVMKYYYKLVPEEELITGTAATIGTNASNEG